MSYNAPTNTDDIIDSRSIIERIETLTSERDDFEGGPEAWAADHPDDAEELRVLLALAEKGEGAPDWPHGETLIRDSYFEEYARQLAEDIGALEKADAWPYYCIDWERAARELQQDYFEVDFDGVTYWVRV